jgi:hypothetical protein
MAKTRLDVGAVVDFLTKGELDQSLEQYRAAADVAEQQALVGIKYMRAPRITGTVYGGTIGSIAGMTASPGLGGYPWGPESGYAWSVMRISVGGLANVNGTGTAYPDTVGIFRNNPAGHPLVTLNANAPYATFGKLNLVFFGGDTMYINQVPNQAVGNTTGTLQATGYLDVTCEVIEVPVAMLGKLA